LPGARTAWWRACSADVGLVLVTGPVFSVPLRSADGYYTRGLASIFLAFHRMFVHSHFLCRMGASRSRPSMGPSSMALRPSLSSAPGPRPSQVRSSRRSGGSNPNGAGGRGRRGEEKGRLGRWIAVRLHLSHCQLRARPPLHSRSHFFPSVIVLWDGDEKPFKW